MPTNAILFDLDNTLYPASSGLLHAIDDRITAYLQRTTGLALEEAYALRQEYLNTYGTTLRGLQQHYGVEAEHYLADIHDMVLESFLASDAELDKLLGQIHATKAIFTNSPREHAERVLAALGIAHHFTHLFDLRFFRFEPKPHPDTYRRALDVLGVSPHNVVLIEDTPRNLPPAKALGMTTILVDEPGHHQQANADYVVTDVVAALRQVLSIE